MAKVYKTTIFSFEEFSLNVDLGGINNRGEKYTYFKNNDKYSYTYKLHMTYFIY